MRRVVLVTGPPCAGKTTHAQTHAQPGDLILDQDLLGRASMNRALAQLATHEGTAWVIRCAPGPRARRRLAQQIQATDHVHLVEPEPVLIARAARRPYPRRHIQAVASWYAKERADQPPTPRRKTGARKMGTTTQRGYGWPHQQGRAAAIRDMQDGQLCTRCYRPMWRTEADTLHYDHEDDRSGYRGLSHPTCNTRAGQAKAMRNRNPKPTAQPTRHSRNW